MDTLPLIKPIVGVWNYRVSQKIVSSLCGYCGGAVLPIKSILHTCIGQASIESLRPCSSQFDLWLLIYGREKAKFVVASKKTELFVVLQQCQN